MPASQPQTKVTEWTLDYLSVSFSHMNINSKLFGPVNQKSVNQAQKVTIKSWNM